MTIADVVVVGAGPAGCAAALTLARSGASVVVIDKARFPRDKCCGDGLTASALRQLEALGLDPGRVESWTPVRRVRLRSPSGRLVELSLPDDGQHAVVARRTDLDGALADLVRHNPKAELVEAEAIADIRVADGGLEVTTSGRQRWRVPFVIAADGAWSPTRKLLAHTGMAGETVASDHDWHAMRQYLTGASTQAAQDLWVWFEADLLPAYAWSFPVGPGLVNFGFGIIRRPGVPAGAMARLWPSLLARPHIRGVLGGGVAPVDRPKAWPIPASRHHGWLSAAQGRVLFAGDAARTSDPMTGEGIGQALETGCLAATAVLSCGTGPGSARRAAEDYRAAVKRGVARDNGLADALARVLTHPLGARATLAAADLCGWTRNNFARWMFESYPRAVLATPGRWRPGLFSPPGAYRST